MRIITIYTLYGRRAGAELCFERTVKAIKKLHPEIKWIILCNKFAKDILKTEMQFAEVVYVSWLDNQYKKAFWLEYLSPRFINSLHADCFWIPSGCNHFPGKWNIPTLSTFHDLGEYHVRNKYSMARMIFRKQICIPRNLKRANRFTAVSSYTKGDMVKFLGLKDEQIRVVYNGTSPHNMVNIEDSLSAIRNYGLEESKYLFTPGRTDYIGKGLDVLIAAYEKFSLKYPRVKLVLVGPQGEGHQELINSINNSQIKENIMYLGRVDNETLVSLYSHCISTIIPSRFEGFGFPVLEAMQFNVPIICSDAGALREVAGNAALIFHSEDFEELYNLLEKVYFASPDMIKELQDKGRERLNFFSWEKCASEMYDEFFNITRQKI